MIIDIAGHDSKQPSQDPKADYLDKEKAYLQFMLEAMVELFENLSSAVGAQSTMHEAMRENFQRLDDVLASSPNSSTLVFQFENTSTNNDKETNEKILKTEENVQKLAIQVKDDLEPNADKKKDGLISLQVAEQWILALLGIDSKKGITSDKIGTAYKAVDPNKNYQQDLAALEKTMTPDQALFLLNLLYARIQNISAENLTTLNTNTTAKWKKVVQFLEELLILLKSILQMLRQNSQNSQSDGQNVNLLLGLQNSVVSFSPAR